MNKISRWIAILGLCLLAAMPGEHVSAAQTAQPAGCDDALPAGVLLLRPVSPNSSAMRDLIAADPATGEELARIDLPLIDIAFPTKVPGLALAVSGAELYLIDVATFSSSKISLGGDTAQDLTPNPAQFRGTSGTRFMLLGSPSFDRVFMIDLLQGVAVNLTASVPPPAPDAAVFLSFAAVTPDDQYVVMWDGRHIYVVETANPETARLVEDEGFAFAPDFSPDGTELIYSQSAGPGSGSTLMIESTDGTDRRELRVSDFAMVTLWVPDSRTIFIDERTEAGAAAGVARLLDIDSGEETELLSYSGSLTSVQLSPDGTAALLGVELMSAGVWHLADLKAGSVEELSQVSSGRALPGLYGDTRWSLIVPLSESTDPLSGPVYRGINLQTGAVSRLLEQSRRTTYERLPLLSSDSSHSLVFGQTDTYQELWLLDATALEVWKLAEGVNVDAQFSPDDCFVVIGITGEGESTVIVEPSTTEPSATPVAQIDNVQFLAWVAS